MLSEQRFDAIMQGQTGLARKVYEAIPISQRWNQNQISSELARLGKIIDHRVLAGCLAALVDRGVVSCNNGTYQREPVRATPVRPVVIDVPTKEATMNKPSAVTLVQPSNPIVIDPVVRMGEIAAMLRGVADKMDDLALDVQQTLDGNQQDLSKLKQLQTLLKSLG